MARIKHGINGPVSGKVGSVVGCTWKGINYIRSLPTITKKRSDGQVGNQNRLSYVNEWLEPFKPFAAVGFMNYSDTMTWYNAAYRFNHEIVPAQNEITSAVDYSAMVLSDGPLRGLGQPEVVATGNGELNFTWKSLYSSRERQNDELLVLLYIESLHDSDCSVAGALRSDGKFTFKYRDDFAGHTAEVFIAFTSFNRKKASKSQYLGSIQL